MTLKMTKTSETWGPHTPTNLLTPSENMINRAILSLNYSPQIKITIKRENLPISDIASYLCERKTQINLLGLEITEICSSYLEFFK